MYIYIYIYTFGVYATKHQQRNGMSVIGLQCGCFSRAYPSFVGALLHTPPRYIYIYIIYIYIYIYTCMCTTLCAWEYINILLFKI